ncbi:uracil-DNA glycosylase [Patescibacteria group bacterium]|nr:uracil-DNA glycosylase [Patescibacteria group bacterium]
MEYKNLEELYGIASKCERCALQKTRTNVVPGDGNKNAQIMFIGEGPGKNEDIQGIPFVGAAGRILDEMLALVNLDRQDVYIANVVKCRPPENRDPEPEEVKACWPYLKEQVRLINPQIIITLGRHAMYRFLPSDLKISTARGKVYRYKSIVDETKHQIYLPLYHPAVALYNPNQKKTLFEDFKKIPKILKKINNEIS